MKVICNAVCDDCVSSVITALTASYDIDFLAENVYQLALSFVTPLSPEDHRNSRICHFLQFPMVLFGAVRCLCSNDAVNLLMDCSEFQTV
jgi:hypothetical protein